MIGNKKTPAQERRQERVNLISCILNSHRNDAEKIRMLLTIIEGAEREAFNAGKSAAYREIFDEFKKIGKRNPVENAE